MSKVVVFGDDSDLNNPPNNFRHNRGTNGHEDGKSSDEGKSSVNEPPVTRMVSFEGGNTRVQRPGIRTSFTGQIGRTGSDIMLQTQASIRNFQQSLDEYSGSPQSPHTSQKNNNAGSQQNLNSAMKSARKNSQDDVNPVDGNMVKIHRQKSVMGPKTAYELEVINDELTEGMSCGGKSTYLT